MAKAIGLSASVGVWWRRMADFNSQIISQRFLSPTITPSYKKCELCKTHSSSTPKIMFLASEVFHFNEEEENFESYSKENGFTYWLATDLMKWLGYSTAQSWNNVINRAIQTCTTLSMPIFDHFIQVQVAVDGGKTTQDFKLSRFACYLVAMNGDNKKENVALAQAYFATIAEAIQNYLEETSKVERGLYRSEISEREKSLSGVVSAAGIENFAFFQNAGYRGMYNMTLSHIRKMRGIDEKRLPLDFMGKDELAANLFRITQTELKIKSDEIKGQPKLEATAENVGRQVRKSMIEISGVTPESMPVAEDIKELKKELKGVGKKLKQIGEGNPKRLKKKK